MQGVENSQEQSALLRSSTENNIWITTSTFSVSISLSRVRALGYAQNTFATITHEKNFVSITKKCKPSDKKI